MIKKISSGIALTLRVLKNALLRPFRVIYSKVNYLFSAGRVATAIPGAVKKLPKIAKRKPEKREDYFDWGSIYVAKSLVLLIAVLLVAIPLVYIFLLHPLFTSWWWVRDFQEKDAALGSYSGRVRIYYGEQPGDLKFEGRLKDGKYTEYGEEYWENGRNKYAGDYADGQYSGSGILYAGDGAVLYRGEFADGKYNGSGELSENGVTLSGEFRNGVLQGAGTITRDGVTLFAGDFVDGAAEGSGKENYDDGAIHYSGSFSAGAPHGEALEYYPDGTLKYNGRFTAGKYNGEGTLYAEDGTKLYSGGFEMGKYSGTGTLYRDGERLYSGEFEQGIYSGSGTLYSADGTVTTGTFRDGGITGAAVRTYPNGMKYEGCFAGELPEGAGTLTDAAGNTVYSGQFEGGSIAYSAIVGQEASAVADSFPDAVRTVTEDGFLLTVSGVALECSFASWDSPAAVRAVYALPIGGAEVRITSAEDIPAEGAFETAAALPGAAEMLGVQASDVKCWTAVKDGLVRCWWTFPDGTLILESASAENSQNAPAQENTESAANADIARLFEDIGLDVRDFESLGFQGVDDET